MEPVFSLPLAAAYTLARLTVCGPEAPPAFQLHFTAAEPVFHTSDSASALRQRAPANPNINPAEFPVTSGLTVGDIRAASSILFEAEASGGRYCLWAQKVQINVTYRANVYIAHEYKQGSCRFEQTRTHELRHVRADRDTLDEYLPGIKQRIGGDLRQLQPLGPITAAERETAQNNLLRQLEQHLNGELAQIEAVRSARQQAIDTPAEYRRLSAACPGERP